MVGYVLVVGVPFLIAWLLTPRAARWATRMGMVDRPGGRRRHRGVVPRAGGIPLAVAFLVGLFLPQLFPSLFPPLADPNQPIWFRGLVAGTVVALLGGLWDDFRELPPSYQFGIQFLCGVIAIASTLFIERINNPLTDRQVVFPAGVVWVLTLFWVMGMMNTVNWLDGVDGLAASVGGIFSLVLVIHLFSRGLGSVALWPLALLGALLGFLPYNWPPARVFLGSGGAYTLGYVMAVLGIAAGAKVATVLLVLGLPIADVAWQIVRRWREGRSPFTGDRGHLHLRLYDRGWSPRRIVLLYVAWEGIMGLVALTVSSRLLKLFLLVIMVAIAVAVLFWTSRGVDGSQ
ncbi:MAG: undecaprenyl/decaprenyl-phosphate alpha-N-acetylglucosaminyl 1-phosphate transferase [Chloroflexi bacterium]|nr:undecaprenyl/decaprenyl-phosphate alpha-N-acetylglucosaminyl 1-phosphate transferase [Chloroflexota bacterium]